MRQKLKKKARRIAGQALYRLYKYLSAVKHNVLITNLGTTSYCKHSPSCSSHFISQVGKHGLLKGAYRGFRRVLMCF